MLNLFGKLKQLDVYRKVPKDLTESSVLGGLVTVVCGLILLILFGSELFAYWKVRTNSELLVDVDRNNDPLRINLNLSLPFLSCDVLSLDAQDILGKHIVDVSTHLHKTKINSNQGCNLKGYLDVSKVSGNFHISSHGKSYSTILNLEHHINELSFGDANKIQTKKNEGIVGAFHPLDDTHQDTNEQHTLSFEYFIQIVPTALERIDGQSFHSYQFTVNSASWSTDGRHQPTMPSIYFRYEFSPITVKFKQEREGFFRFMVQLCAIVGGVFTAAGLFANTSMKILDKMKVGKQN